MSGLAGSTPADALTVLEITVTDHPGVMVHVCSLFSRRAYNMDGIVCLPIRGQGTSRMWILVTENRCLDQLAQQLLKLYDVHTVRRLDVDGGMLTRLEALFESTGSGPDDRVGARLQCFD
jgi:acetolactate synthase-1/3 small subunit